MKTNRTLCFNKVTYYSNLSVLICFVAFVIAFGFVLYIARFICVRRIHAFESHTLVFIAVSECILRSTRITALYTKMFIRDLLGERLKPHTHTLH